MKGNTVKLSDYKGKKVYLKFWATWCGPCRQSMPELEKLVKDTDRDFEILTIMAPGMQGEKTEEEFVKWFDQQDYKSVPVLYNPDGSAFADYQVRSIPTEVFIDSHGKIGQRLVGGSGPFAPAGGHGSADATSGASDAGGHGDGGHGDADATSGASN